VFLLPVIIITHLPETVVGDYNHLHRGALFGVPKPECEFCRVNRRSHTEETAETQFYDSSTGDCGQRVVFGFLFSISFDDFCTTSHFTVFTFIIATGST
jgi:hypothetical protein